MSFGIYQRGRAARGRADAVEELENLGEFGRACLRTTTSEISKKKHMELAVFSCCCLAATHPRTEGFPKTSKAIHEMKRCNREACCLAAKIYLYDKL